MNVSRFSLVLSFLASLTISVASQACDLTINSSGNIQSALNTPSVTTVCLQSGTYSTTSAILVGAGQTLKGVGSTRNDVVISSTAVEIVKPGSGSTVYNLSISGGSSTAYGVLAYGLSGGATIWHIKVEGATIGIGVHTSSGVGIYDVLLQNNGRSNSLPDPAIWIFQSPGTYVYYGNIYGAGGGPGGDGELACHDSSGVTIEGTESSYAGASSFYFVNCDNSTLKYTSSYSSGEWGIDVPSGSDNFTALGNYVTGAYFGGAVFQETGNSGGVFTNNTFVSNVTSSWTPCNGINIMGNPSNVALSGNSATPSPASCAWSP